MVLLQYSKLIVICLTAAVVAFTISTIVLAVQKSNVENELTDVRNKLDILEETLRQTTTTFAPSSTTTSPAQTTPTTTTQSTTQSIPTTTEVATTTTQPTPNVNYRLSGSVIPEHYDLYLFPNVETGIFTGQELITVSSVVDTDTIEIHSQDLTIERVYVNRVSSTIFVKNFDIDTVRDILIIEFNEVIPANITFELGILFNGKLSGSVGLYSSSYLKPDGSRKTIATSKFEPTYARQAFPCFDEPGMKATFRTTLVHPATGGYHALSNMDIEETKLQGNVTEVYFRTSVPMSTYLACFIVSDFTSNSALVDTKGIGEPFNISVYATPAQLNKVEFALDVGKTVIEHYISYFQIEYPLPKLDMAAIPDFVSGAMEHWGLVTYRETALLYEEGVSSSANKQSVASVIAHEFAHMWFGNLVTMKWWNDLWLNEGFADYIENKGMNAKFPEWKMLDQFLIDTIQPVLVTDATTASHPIIQTVSTPDQITEIFDTITYSKGASIIRMLENFLGAEAFRTAVTNYLNQYKYDNAVTANFFNEIDKLDLGIDVPEIMRTWTEQMGFPVVDVTQLSATQYRLTQKRFLSNPEEYLEVHNDTPFNYKWSIPITYVTSASSEVTYQWFYYNQSDITITLPSDVNWIKFNHDQVGFYRVNYQQSMWENLAAILLETPDVFTVSDRASILNDAFSLADATQLPYQVSLEMMQYLSKENDYVPWSVAISKLGSLKNTLLFTDAFQNYQSYARSLISPIYEKVTWNVGTDHLQNLLRSDVLSTACALGVPDCLAEAGNRMKAWLANPTQRPHPDVRSTVYYYGMLAVGDEEIWEQMWNLYLSETDASEKTKLMSGLSAIQIPWVLSRYMNMAWDERNVRGQDYFTCLQYIANNRVGEPLVWDYVRENWPKLVDRFGLNERYLGRMIPRITRRFSTNVKLEEMESFFAKYPEAGAGAANRLSALAAVKNNIAWLQNNLDNVSAWLQIKQNNN